MPRHNRYTQGFFAATALYASASNVHYVKKHDRGPEQIGYNLGLLYGFAHEIHDKGVPAEMVRLNIRRGWSEVSDA